MPKVSFVIPAFRDTWLRMAVASLLNQTMEDVEVLIFNNNHLDINCKDERVRVFDTPGYAPPRCYNEARRLARSHFILPSTDDDWWLAERALISYEYLTRGWDYIAGSCLITNELGVIKTYNVVKPFTLERQKYYANTISLPFIGYKKDVVPDYDESFKICYDYLFHLQCGLKDLKMQTLRTTLGYKREWEGSLYKSFPREDIRKEIDRIRVMFNDTEIRRRDFK